MQFQTWQFLRTRWWFNLSSLFVQPNGTIVINSLSEDFSTLQPQIAGFSELVQQTDTVHIYQILPLTLWQAAATGLTARDVLTVLRDYTDVEVPYVVQEQIVLHMSRWGKLWMQAGPTGQFDLVSTDKELGHTLRSAKIASLGRKQSSDTWRFPISVRANVKRKLAQAGYPCIDRIGYQNAETVTVCVRSSTKLRQYQLEAVEKFCTSSSQSGIVVLPCGAGKTLVGLGCLAGIGRETLILTPTEMSANQWIREIHRHLDVKSDAVTLYNPKQPLSPITVTTYPKIAARNRKGTHTHWERLASYPWGFVIYDEVHMLPAPLFRLAAEMQSVRRLGLTATLIREDGAETDVFSLIGPKCYEAQWKVLEQSGYLAEVTCKEIRIPLTPAGQLAYQRAGPQERHRIAAVNSNKLLAMSELLIRHKDEQIIVLGHYISQLKEAAKHIGCPLLSGEMAKPQREFWLNQFRTGNLRCLVMSRVANMAIDVPSASVCIQISGLYGSRQEEAQRLGRLLRPDSGPGTFYTLVSADTVEENMARHRSLFLLEQGYTFDISDWTHEGDAPCAEKG